MSPNGKRVAVVGGALLAAGAIVGVTMLATSKADAATSSTKKLATGVVETSKWKEIEVGGTPITILMPGTLYYFIGGADPAQSSQGIQQKLAQLGWSVVNVYMPGDTIPDQSAPLQKADGTRIVRSDDQKTPIAGSPFTVNASNNKVVPGAFHAIAYWRGQPVPLNPLDIPIAWSQSEGA